MKDDQKHNLQSDLSEVSSHAPMSLNPPIQRFSRDNKDKRTSLTNHQDPELAENIQILQRQNLQEIGANLLRIRTEKDLELDAIVAKTQITKRVLIAIEQGHLEDLPEPFYTKALIKKYAKALGIVDIPDYTVVDLDEVTIGTKSDKKLNLGTYIPQWQLPRWQLRAQHLYVLYLVLVVVAIKGISTVVDNPSNTEEPILFTETDITQTTSTSITNSTNSPSQTSTSSPKLVTQSNSSISDSVVVDVTVKERCWLKVVVDEKVEFEGILDQGTNRTWTGKEKITIVAGNAGGVVVTYNHGQGKILGAPGQVEEVTYTLN